MIDDNCAVQATFAGGPDIFLRYSLTVSEGPDGLQFDLKPYDNFSQGYLRSRDRRPPIIQFPKGEPWYQIQYKLRDDTARGLRFHVGNPIDAAEFDSVVEACCPKPGSGVHTDQLKSLFCAGSEIRVVNANQREVVIGYGLNFVNRAGKRDGAFDPIYENTGGGRPGFI